MNSDFGILLSVAEERDALKLRVKELERQLWASRIVHSGAVICCGDNDREPCPRSHAQQCTSCPYRIEREGRIAEQQPAKENPRG